MTELITRKQLGRLLMAKVVAQKAYSEARRKHDATCEETGPEKIDADLEFQRVLTASCAADAAYHDALVAYGEQQANS